MLPVERNIHVYKYKKILSHKFIVLDTQNILSRPCTKSTQQIFPNALIFYNNIINIDGIHVSHLK